MSNVLDKFKLDGKVAIITGGAGLLGEKHAESIAEAGGVPVLWDINIAKASVVSNKIAQTFKIPAKSIEIDITNKMSVIDALKTTLSEFGRVDILINNAANDPKVSKDDDNTWSRFENLDLSMWQKDISVGLTGAFLCSQAIGSHMAENGGGVILNIASDLGVIAPDQRIYRKDGLSDNEQPVKPVTYSVVKHALLGLTKYLATYWADKGIRANSLSPGGVYNEQSEEFVDKLTNLIPMGRMANIDEYKAAILFLVSDASSYATGANFSIDGGRTTW